MDNTDTPDPTDTARHTIPLEVALFPSTARDRAWDQPSALDLLDVANGAVRRLEALAWLLGESLGAGVSEASPRRATGIAELLDDVAVSLRVVVAEMVRRQEQGG